MLSKSNTIQKSHKLSLAIIIFLLLGLLFFLKQSYAQWPPFRFILIPSYEAGKVTYHIEFRDRVDWTMTDITIKIPLPEGTRFLEASAIPTIDSSFDGEEVTFLAPVLSRRIKTGDAFFVVEITDPTMTTIKTHAWIMWQGNQPGDYLTKDVSIDITRQPLNWEKPSRSRLQLEAGATVVDGIITYFIYPRNVGGRMWDVKINVPVPEGTTFLSADTAHPFVSHFDGLEVSFFAAELARWSEIGPLSFKVSVDEVTDPVITTRAWATWKNVGRKVGRSIVIQEETVTGDIIVQPHTSQRVVADILGDVPFSNYDVVNIALQEVVIPENELALKITFRAAGTLGPVGGFLHYNLYIDSDCQPGTGRALNGRGVDYRILYRHEEGRADLRSWVEEEKRWKHVKRIRSSLPDDQTVTIWVPYELLDDGQQFCWVARIWNGTQAFTSSLPTETVPNSGDLRMARYEVVAAATEIKAEEAEIFATKLEPSAGVFIDVGDTWQYLPGWSEPAPDWNTTGFDDSDWFSGATKIGYGEGKFATDLSKSAQNGGIPVLVQRVDKQSGMVVAVLSSGEDVDAVFIRHPFTVTDFAWLTELELEVAWEGGFVTYLNGVEVARRRLGEPEQTISYDTLATNREVGSSKEVFDLSLYIPNLITGTNVLAVQAHRSEGSSNLSITPKLTWEFNPVDISPLDDSNSPAPALSVPSSPPPTMTDISGKLAVPIDNGQIAYDVHIFSMPDGQAIAKVPNARQPNFRFDGQRLLINHEGGGIENTFEYNLADGAEKQVTDAPQDWHPFYDSWGNRVVYGNSGLTAGSAVPLLGEDGQVVRNERDQIIYHNPSKPFIFVQCGLLPPHQETEPRCRNIPWLGVLVPAGQMGEIQGTHPVWTTNDMIAYRGCNSWAGFRLCGIYIVPSSSTKGFSDGFIPRQLTRESSDTPSDTKGDLIAFTSQRDGNFEAYIMDLNGEGVRNLSNSPDSTEGLPTISPDGNWVAFVSDRGGQWAVWVVPVVGGPAQKLFDLPADIPWGDGTRVWMNERISWGP